MQKFNINRNHHSTMSPQSISTSLAGCTRQTAIVIEDGPERQQTPEVAPDPVMEPDTHSKDNDLPHFIVKDEAAADDKSSYREETSASNSQSEISTVDEDEADDEDDDEVEESDDEDDELPLSTRLRQRPCAALTDASIPYSLEGGPVLEGATSVARGENSSMTRSGGRFRVKHGDEGPVKGKANEAVCESTTTTLAVPGQMFKSDSGREDYPAPLLTNVRTRSMATLKRKRNPTTSDPNVNSFSSTGTTKSTPFPSTEMLDPTEYAETPSRTALPTRKIPSLIPRTETRRSTTPSSVSTKRPRISGPAEPQSERTRSKILHFKLRQPQRSSLANSASNPQTNTNTNTVPLLESDLYTTPVSNINRSGAEIDENLTQLLATERAARRRLQEENNGLRWEVAEKERAYRLLMERYEGLKQEMNLARRGGER